MLSLVLGASLSPHGAYILVEISNYRDVASCTLTVTPLDCKPIKWKKLSDFPYFLNAS